MKTYFYKLVLVSLFLYSCSLRSQNSSRFNDGFITVFKVTSGSALTNSGTAVVIEEFNPDSILQSAPNYSVSFPTTGGNKLAVSGTASSAGGITRSENGQSIIVPGYDALVGDLNSTFTTNGALRTVNGTGTVGVGITGGGTTQWLSGSNNLRSGTSDDGTNYWFAGNGIGIQTSTNGTSLSNVSATSTNNRDVFIFNGQLYLTTGAGTKGIYSVGTGKPTTTGQVSSLLFSPTNGDCYSFSISPDGKTIYYVSASSGGIYRSTFNGTVWTTGAQIYSGTNYTGLVIDWTDYVFSTSSVNSAKIYASNPSTIISAIDNGVSLIIADTIRYETNSSNNAYRQIAFSPIKQTVVKGSNTPATGLINPGTTDVVLYQFNLSSDEGNSTIKKLKLTQTGTATIGLNNDLNNFRLVEDINNNGLAEPGELSSFLATGVVTDSLIVFSNIVLNTYITQNSSKNFLVIADVDTSAIGGNTFIPTIAVNKSLNSINYTTDIVNAGGSWVFVGNGGTLGNILTVASNTPLITVDTVAFNSSFGNVVVNTASSTSSFIVSGSYLTANVIITPPAGFEIRTGSNSFSSNSITLIPSNGTVSLTTIDVRFLPTNVISYIDTIKCTSNGAISKNVLVNGVGINQILATNLAIVSMPSISLVSTNVSSFNVEARKNDNTVDTAFTGIINLNILTGVGTLSGTTSVTAVAGVATFNLLQFDTTGVFTIQATSVGLIPDTSASITIVASLSPSLTDVIIPQYMEGNSPSNITRLPFVYRVTLENLSPNATYRYFNQAVTSADPTTTSGAGNTVYAIAGGFKRTTSPGLSTVGTYNSFVTDNNGQYTGWFILEPTGNSRFTPGNYVFMRIMLNNGAGGTSVSTRLTTTDSVKVLDFSSNSTSGTGLKGLSSALPRNFVFAYDDINGSSRPISGTYVETDSVLNTSGNSYVAFYANDVESVNGAYGMIIPNTNANGIRRIEQRDFYTAAILGCAAIDSNGVWPSGANTVNPMAGPAAVAITTNDAVLDPYSNASVGGVVASGDTVCSGYNNDTLNLTGNVGSIIKWQYSIDGFSNDVNDINNTSASQIYANLVQNTSYRAVIKNGSCLSSNSSPVEIVIVSPPNVSIDPFTTPICNGGSSITLTGGSPLGGYYSGQGVASGMFDPSISGVGSFVITYTYNDSMCSNSDTASILVSYCTGVEKGEKSSIVVSPNPSSGLLSISFNNLKNINSLTLTIVDVYGKKIYNNYVKEIASDYKSQIDLQKVSKGIYYLRAEYLTAENELEVGVQKIIIH